MLIGQLHKQVYFCLRNMEVKIEMDYDNYLEYEFITLYLSSVKFYKQK